MGWEPQGAGRGSFPARDDVLAAASGVIWQPDNPRCYPTGSASAPASQVVYGVLAGLLEGDEVTGIVLRVGNGGAAGSLPSLARAGLADSSGKILALSGNLNALSYWASGANPLPFTAKYQIPTSGGYFACFVVNGTWGSTQPTLLNHSGIGTGKLALPGSPPPGFNWGGQTDLPAVGGQLTLTGQDSGSMYIAAY